jgi:hypothetical protein
MSAMYRIKAAAKDRNARPCHASQSRGTRKSEYSLASGEFGSGCQL